MHIAAEEKQISFFPSTVTQVLQYEVLFVIQYNFKWIFLISNVFPSK